MNFGYTKSGAQPEASKTRSRYQDARHCSVETPVGLPKSLRPATLCESEIRRQVRSQSGDWERAQRAPEPKGVTASSRGLSASDTPGLARARLTPEGSQTAHVRRSQDLCHPSGVNAVKDDFRGCRVRSTPGYRLASLRDVAWNLHRFAS